MKAYNLTKLIASAIRYKKLILSIVNVNFNMESQSGWLKHLLETLGEEWGYCLFVEGDCRCKVIYRKDSWFHNGINHQLKLAPFKKVFVSRAVWEAGKLNKYEWWVFLPNNKRIKVFQDPKLGEKELRFEL